MKTEGVSYSLPIEVLPDAYAYHQVITDNYERPVDYIYVDVNPAYARMIGLEKRELVGRRVTEVLSMLKDDEFDWVGVYGNVALTGEGIRFEHYFEPLNCWYEITVYSDQPGYFGTIYHEITEKKAAEDEISELISKLEAELGRNSFELESTRKELGVFTSSISQNLKPSLNSIIELCRVLRDEYAFMLDDRARDHIYNICQSAFSLSGLLEALSKFSMVNSCELNYEPVELSVMIRAYLKQLHDKEPHRKVELLVEPNQVVRGDTALLRMAIGEILENAWKFSSGKELAKIEFGFMEKDDQLVYYVRDNGIGFSPQDSDLLFTPFQSLHQESGLDGKGMGLNIASRIIARHGGEIWADGEPGEFAFIYFTLQ